MNKANFKKVLDKIKSCPEEWRQSMSHCGVQHCFFGHAQIMAGKEPNSDTVLEDGMAFFGMARLEAEYFFSVRRTLDDFERALR